MIPVNQYVLYALLIAAAYVDLKTKKIPNFVTFPVMIWGVVSYIVVNSSSGLLFSLVGLAVGIAVFFIPFALGGMGAGDVKMLGAIGALAGAEFVLTTALIAALVGGVMALFSLARRKRLLQGIVNVVYIMAGPVLTLLAHQFRLKALHAWLQSFKVKSKAEKDPIYLPYGVAIAVGAVIALTNLFPYAVVL